MLVLNLFMFKYMFAPIENYSDNALRTLCFNHGADLTFTEMTRVEGIIRRNKPTLTKIKISDNTPVQIQLLPGNEDQLDKYLTNFEGFDGFKGFNFNLSCPSRKVMKDGRGAAMVKRIEKTNRLISIVKKHNYPISLKIRLGANNIEKEYKVYVKLIEQTDPDFFIVHAKYGMQRSDEPTDDTIYPACVDVAKGKPIIANGGINTKKRVEKVKKLGVSGVMIGRPALQNPAIFDLLKDKATPSLAELKEEYLELATKFDAPLKYRKNLLAKLFEEAKGV